MTIAEPVPSTQLVPDKRKGEGGFTDEALFSLFSLTSILFIISTHFSYTSFLSVSDSPVKALSSIFIPFPSINKRSAGIISPIIIFTKSPTNKSSLGRSDGSPFLITLYFVPSF